MDEFLNGQESEIWKRQESEIFHSLVDSKTHPLYMGIYNFAWKMVNPVNIIHVTILLDNTYTDKIVYHAANKIAHPAPANLLMSENVTSGFFN